MLRHNLCSAMEHACPAVVPEAAPDSQNVRLISIGKRADCRKSCNELLVMLQHRIHSRLLEHDLRDPDAVWIVSLTPRKYALVVSIPCEKLSPKAAQR